MCLLQKASRSKKNLRIQAQLENLLCRNESAENLATVYCRLIDPSPPPPQLKTTLILLTKGLYSPQRSIYFCNFRII
jgi:hypothetical protein